jgi:hypothetical protein
LAFDFAQHFLRAAFYATTDLTRELAACPTTRLAACSSAT